MNNYSIRVEEERDYSTVESLVRDSFWNVYRPGCTEHYVLHHLRNCPDFIPELAFVMEADGKIIGQNVFGKAQTSGTTGVKNKTLSAIYNRIIVSFNFYHHHKWSQFLPASENPVIFLLLQLITANK